jgi:hypothetical protein
MSEFAKLGGYEDAVIYADEIISDYLSVVPLKQLKQMDLHFWIMGHHPMIKVIGDTPTTTGYQVTEEMAGFLTGTAHKNEVSQQIAMNICAANVFNGYDLPEPLRAFASMAIRGHAPKPKKEGEEPLVRTSLSKCI